MTEHTVHRARPLLALAVFALTVAATSFGLVGAGAAHGDPGAPPCGTPDVPCAGPSPLNPSSNAR